MLAKSKLICIKVFVSKSLLDSVISHGEFILLNNGLKEYNKMKKEIRNSNIK